MIVADASAILEVLLNTVKCRRHSASLVGAGADDTHPSPRGCRGTLQDYADLPLVRYPHDVLLPRLGELRHNLTAYEAVYLALAEALDAPLATCDHALAPVPGHRATVVIC
jgi:predicted nucleic acid-binding protein